MESSKLDHRRPRNELFEAMFRHRVTAIWETRLFKTDPAEPLLDWARYPSARQNSL